MWYLDAQRYKDSVGFGPGSQAIYSQSVLWSGDSLLSARVFLTWVGETLFKAQSISFMPICAMTCPSGTEHHLPRAEQIVALQGHVLSPPGKCYYFSVYTEELTLRRLSTHRHRASQQQDLNPGSCLGSPNVLGLGNVATAMLCHCHFIRVTALAPHPSIFVSQGPVRYVVQLFPFYK